jgi:hypothetical protein
MAIYQRGCMRFVGSVSHLALGSLMLAVLAACGGGGDGGSGGGGGGATPVVETPILPAAPSFPLQAGHRALVASTTTDEFVVSGWCEGTASITNEAATPATFEGVAGFQAVSAGTITFEACDAAGTYSGQTTRYFDANYSPIGSTSDEGDFTSYEALPAALPTSVKVGDAGEYAVLNEYADSSKSSITGQIRYSYLVEADSPATAGTARIVLIEDSYSPSGEHLFKDRTRYRITSNGSMTLLSTDSYSYFADAFLLYSKI